MTASTHFIIIIALISSAIAASITPLVKANGECGRVWITIHSPEIKQQDNTNTLLDAIELNWDFDGCNEIPTKIGLFSKKDHTVLKPTTFQYAIELFDIASNNGYVITNTSLHINDITLPGFWNDGERSGISGPHCLWPHVAIGNNDKMFKENCFKIQPTWMEDNLKYLSSIPIGNLVLPGTHNAGSFAYNTEINTASRDRWGLCQDRTIWEQLVHGVRYLDFRIAYYSIYEEMDNRFWLNHNFVRVRSLLPLLKDIRKFLDATKEVVILDAHHFPLGFYDTDNRPINDAHSGLLEIIKREFGDHIASYQVYGQSDPLLGGPTLSELINDNKRLIVSYVDNSITTANTWLWPNLPHLWANTNNADRLFEYLDNAIATSPAWNAKTPFHSAMAQTTSTALDILLMRSSIRENADLVNRNITSRLRYHKDWNTSANIVSTDFFLGNDVIDVSLSLNLERARDTVKWSKRET